MNTIMNEDELNKVSMQIILHAGDARNQITEALNKIGDEQFDAASELLTQAQENLKKAHESQTSTIQSAAQGMEIPYSVLFTHAQDTLMTIMSELNLAKQLIKLFRKVSFKED
ncbi:PTS lactose/cellobiose transporter subunit IIA [Schleiferilactobacillus perolens]|uniref:Uncharacterized protein n=1 Tax=Schleiferilactobacillus perolens DSM 12744 TaxID=1423792 RepID=A0A0R1N2T6_9LACO|nr:PTS lactose/cellobiose transporter subunit IIA [Schleiferilactobacillus perolens]KRL14630.1 hypothetical protein FD09_GL000283 [Schleiferilactobacillus perolens DSM 12744]MCI2170038.1 PTS lactose/cellobiose transporter subunit IIA [Schleiferilactobacillus perolens]